MNKEWGTKLQKYQSERGEVRRKLSDLAERHGIDTTGADLIWKDGIKKGAATLDHFWS